MELGTGQEKVGGYTWITLHSAVQLSERLQVPLFFLLASSLKGGNSLLVTDSIRGFWALNIINYFNSNHDKLSQKTYIRILSGNVPVV